MRDREVNWNSLVCVTFWLLFGQIARSHSFPTPNLPSGSNNSSSNFTNKCIQQLIKQYKMTFCWSKNSSDFSYAQVCSISNGGGALFASKLLLTSSSVENVDDKTSNSCVDKTLADKIDARKKRSSQKRSGSSNDDNDGIKINKD